MIRISSLGGRGLFRSRLLIVVDFGLIFLKVASGLPGRGVTFVQSPCPRFGWRPPLAQAVLDGPVWREFPGPLVICPAGAVANARRRFLDLDRIGGEESFDLIPEHPADERNHHEQKDRDSPSTPISCRAISSWCLSITGRPVPYHESAAARMSRVRPRRHSRTHGNMCSGPRCTTAGVNLGSCRHWRGRAMREACGRALAPTDAPLSRCNGGWGTSEARSGTGVGDRRTERKTSRGRDGEALELPVVGDRRGDLDEARGNLTGTPVPRRRDTAFRGTGGPGSVRFGRVLGSTPLPRRSRRTT